MNVVEEAYLKKQKSTCHRRYHCMPLFTNCNVRFRRCCTRCIPENTNKGGEYLYPQLTVVHFKNTKILVKMLLYMLLYFYIQ